MFLVSFTLFPGSTLDRESGIKGGHSGRPNAATQDRDTQHGRHLPQGDSVKVTLLLAIAIVLSLGAVAQTNSQTMAVEPMTPTPTFRVNVISRSVKVANCEHRVGSTKLDFAGIDLLPRAKVQVRV